MDGVLLNGAPLQEQPPPPTPLEVARTRYMKALEKRLKADATPVHPLILRSTLDCNETLIEGLLDVLVAKGVLTIAEVEAAQTARYDKLVAVIEGTTQAAIDAKPRLEVARTLPPGRA